MSKVPEVLERWPGKSSTKIRDAYGDDEAREYEEAHWLKLRIEARTRRRRFGDAGGSVLDVACGTGVNFQYLPDTADIVGVDISRDMLGEQGSERS